MSESYSLIKENPLLPAEDYNALRKAGFKGIEKLGSNIWTDYNNSDPGITMLEALCYAITDLAYRTGFEVKDLLASREADDDKWKNIFYTARQIFHNNPLTISDYRKLILDVKGVRNAWVEPSKDYEVPVWVDYNYYEKRKPADCACEDEPMQTCYGKLGLQPAVKEEVDKRNQARLEEIKKIMEGNAKKITDLQTKITALQAQILVEKDPLTLINLKNQLEAFTQQKTDLENANTELNTEKDTIAAAKFIPSKIIELEGLYNVMVEYEEDVLEEDHREEVRQQVLDRLMAHRNLCEDFLSVNAVEYIDFGIGGSFVLEEYADPDTVLAQVFFVIYKYFTPAVPFHTISQMMEKGYQADEIFEGPALHHGFIDTAELERTDLYRDIRLSDIISEIADIKGIRAITYLHLPFNGFDDDNSGKNYFNQWIEMLRQERKVARIQPSQSSILFCKEHDFITYNTGREGDRRPQRMLKLFRDLKQLERRYRLEGYQNDFSVPDGEFMDLQDYYPVVYSLPMCYGASERAGLPSNADEKRKVQELQLKGYMLFFEQLLADHLVQLDHLKDLFSFDDKQDKTYFTRTLEEIKELKEKLLIDHQNRNNPDLVLKDFAEVLQSLTETPATFSKRRNQFLNHLLARFGENMDEYESISRWLTPVEVDKRLIKNKTAMLMDGEYYKISTDRARGYNYTLPDVWDTPNVSGTERRISRLLGFADPGRRTLAPDFITAEPIMITDEKTKTPVQKKNKKGQPLNMIRLVDPSSKEKIILTSVDVVEGCCTEDLMQQILEHADQRRYFRFHEELKQRSRKTAGTLGVFWFELWDDTDPEKAVMLATSEKFDKREEREHAFKNLQRIMHMINDNEGFHLAEHLLFRPRLDEVLDETGRPLPVSFPDICLDGCDMGKGLDEGTEIPLYQKKVHRIPAEKCYDNMPWVLEYFRKNPKSKKYDQSLLFAETFPDLSRDPVPLKFRRYEGLAQRVKDLYEFGSERVNYSIVSNAEEQPEKIKYSFIIHGDNDKVLAQSPFVFNKQTKIQVRDKIAVPEDIEIEIQNLIRYFEFQLDLYCEENSCDNNEDPYSFRTTLVIPCWPKRLRNETFRNLVEKTIAAETPAHVHTRVVWLGIQEMKKFETVYFEWLREMAQTEIPGYEFVNPLIETINTLKPCGCCDDDCG